MSHHAFDKKKYQFLWVASTEIFFFIVICVYRIRSKNDRLFDG